MFLHAFLDETLLPLASHRWNRQSYDHLRVIACIDKSSFHLARAQAASVSSTGIPNSDCGQQVFVVSSNLLWPCQSSPPHETTMWRGNSGKLRGLATESANRAPSHSSMSDIRKLSFSLLLTCTHLVGPRMPGDHRASHDCWHRIACSKLLEHAMMGLSRTPLLWPNNIVNSNASSRKQAASNSENGRTQLWPTSFCQSNSLVLLRPTSFPSLLRPNRLPPASCFLLFLLLLHLPSFCSSSISFFSVFVPPWKPEHLTPKH